MMTRPGDFNAGLQVAPTEASAVLYEHPFPSLYSLLSCIYSPYFARSGSDQFFVCCCVNKISCAARWPPVHRYSYTKYRVLDVEYRMSSIGC